MGGLGRRVDRPRAPRDPWLARWLPRGEPCGRRRVLAGRNRRRLQQRWRTGRARRLSLGLLRGLLLDPDGNSVEAVHTEREDPAPPGRIDHLWLRVREPAASKRFYTTIASYAGLRLGIDDPDHVQLIGESFSFSLIADDRPLTEHVHIALPAQDDATVQAFHLAALAAGYENNGAPGERAIYHPGYYGAFVFNPDGHNVELVNHNR